MKLEELKARSAGCGFYPRLFEIAKEMKSPTAAHELVMKTSPYTEDQAKACRYLAIIKRDHGIAVFNEVVAEITQKGNADIVRFSLMPFIETVSRLIFLQHWLFRTSNSEVKLADYDFILANVVECCLNDIDKLKAEVRAEVLKLFNAGSYIGEAKEFVNSLRASEPIDEYCLQKTGYVLIAYIRVTSEKAGLNEHMIHYGDQVYDKFYDRAKQKQK